MGSWGPGSFENDDALDWLGDLTAAQNWQDVAAVIIQISIIYHPAGACMRAVAACELVAAGAGRPADTLPDAGVTWLAQAGSPPLELSAAAIETVAQIGKNSDLKTLWRDADELKLWRAETSSLMARLKGKRKISEGKTTTVPKPDATALGTLLNKQIAAKNWQQAMDTCDALLALDEKRVVTRNNRAWCLAQLENFKQAKIEVEKALAYANEQSGLSSVSLSACFGTRAHINLRTANYQAAIEDFDRALALNVRSINLKGRADAHRALGHEELAGQDLLAYNDLLVTEALRKALTLWNNTLYGECLLELNKVLEIDPVHRAALIRRAMVNYELKFLVEAESDMCRVIALHGEDVNVLFERAQVRAQMGFDDLARIDRERCHELGFDTIAFYDNRLNQLEGRIANGDKGGLDKSILRELNLLIKVVPENIRARQLKVRVFQSTDESAKAEKELKQIAKIKPLPVVLSEHLEKKWSGWFWQMMTHT